MVLSLLKNTYYMLVCFFKNTSAIRQGNSQVPGLLAAAVLTTLLHAAAAEPVLKLEAAAPAPATGLSTSPGSTATVTPTAPAVTAPAPGPGPTVSATRRTPLVIAAQKTLPSVVNIGTEELVPVFDQFNPFFTDFFRANPRVVKEAIPLGSGVIVDARGLILTNFHVVRRASRIFVRIQDGRTFPAVPLAGDPANDLALLRLQFTAGQPAPTLIPIEFSLPDDLVLGETMVAVGNPFGLENTVSVGVLSARNRTLTEGDRVFHDILQTDAAINPGNSGGPLINLDGQLAGINLAIRRDAEGIGFAIPLRRIENVLARWLRPARLSNADCGFLPQTRITPEGAIQAVATDVDPDSPATKAGLTEGAVLTRINDQPVTRSLDAGRVLWTLKAGDTLRIETGEGKTFAFVLPEVAPLQLIRERLGLQLQELTPALLQALRLPADLKGVVVSSVDEQNPTALSGIQRGDLLMNIGGKPAVAVADIAALLRSAKPGTRLDLDLLKLQQLRNGQFLARQYSISLTLY